MAIRLNTPKERMDELLKRDTLSVPEAAEVLEVSPQSVYRLVRDGKLKHWRKSDGQTSAIVIYTNSVAEFIRKVQGRELKVKRIR